MSIKTLHPIDSFGIAKVSLDSIRADRLEKRVNPKVGFPHKHDFYQILFITQGTGTHSIDFAEFNVRKNQIYIIKPGQTHAWSLSKNIKGFVIEFNRQSLSEMIDRVDHLEDLYELLSKEDIQDIHSICEIMVHESEGSKAHFDVCLKGFLLGFLARLIRVLQPSTMNPTGLSFLDEFRLLLEKHFKEEHGVEFFAQKMGITSKVLTMRMSRLIQKSPRELIQERCILEAKRYLAFSGLNVSQVGAEIGFLDPNYFIRFFKSHEKQTPAQFRKKFTKDSE